MTSTEHSIQEVARLAGTTSRTLRHYDEVGLLAPSRVGSNGYRYYDAESLVRLQRILLLREMGLGIPAIAQVLNGDTADVDAFRSHLNWLKQEQSRLDRQIASVERTIRSLQKGEKILAEQMFDGFEHDYSGKVRDLYSSPEHPDRVLMVASDRVSAADRVLSPAIPGKGALLTELSLWWFEQLQEMPNHLAPRQEWAVIPDSVADRAMLVTKLEMFPIECVVRGYLSGSGWIEYQRSQSVCGVALPAGLLDGDRLPEPIFTPAFKAPLGEHDENITFERMAELIGLQNARVLRDLSLDVFARASAIAETKGIILADTKFEFGLSDGVIVLGDEVLTSDSSRYWDAAAYATGNRGQSLDKQPVRDWLNANWDGEGEPPELDAQVVSATTDRYRELVDRLTRR
jgi:phosphoribosylaminoimidazole-succinocarboxamide synthase